MARKRACLCAEEDIYSVDCCNQGSIYNEGIGDIWGGSGGGTPPPSGDGIVLFSGEPVDDFEGEQLQLME